jgi:hypothetical protein
MFFIIIPMAIKAIKTRITTCINEWINIFASVRKEFVEICPIYLCHPGVIKIIPGWQRTNIMFVFLNHQAGLPLMVRIRGNHKLPGNGGDVHAWVLGRR